MIYGMNYANMYGSMLGANMAMANISAAQQLAMPQFGMGDTGPFCMDYPAFMCGGAYIGYPSLFWNGNNPALNHGMYQAGNAMGGAIRSIFD